MPRVINKANYHEGSRFVSKAKNVIKKEVDIPEEQVFHRKSERRRVARDIFLVFEEQSSIRRGRGSNKRAQPKSKFGHLKVEEPKKAKDCLLRDIKNEPKCFFSNACSRTKTKTLKPNQPAFNRQCDQSIARVNPIFVWVKQDDTRIVEVRCEDYDKRNRIRLTKTSNGWRAIPRTDPSSSKVVKFFQTPLMKVKHEIHEKQKDCNFRRSTEIDQLDCSSSFGKNLMEPKKKKIKKEKAKDKTCVNMCSNSIDIDDVQKASEECVEPKNVNENHAVNCTSDAETNDLKSNDGDGETYHTNTPVLQLCPQTGLFLPNTCHDLVNDIAPVNALNKSILINLVDTEIECNKQSLERDILDSLDDETKNLKDLLDDADLFQHCGDNANSGAEIIDSLVKRSCENNLIEETESHKVSEIMNAFEGTNENLTTEQSISQIIDPVSDPPKCLSFNEAGEIEGINGELFQPNNYIETFNKDTIEKTQINADTLGDTELILSDPSPSFAAGNKVTDVIVENIPKDLSYKKREEVCPPSESHSQCAVTSSSDVVKSPQPNTITGIETTTETIKSLILEQFLKLNTFNNVQQSEPINLGKHRDQSVANKCTKYADASTNYIETVFIDDNSDEEPVKKRVRCSLKSSVNVKDIQQQPSPLVIDKDPDPLTQLQLLIKNTQWKVPDPILVPKDRLGAVLASPAREIPLLITTRPELRLPEAFAYPEIIQNPNILVISMAQLEAILKSEVEMEKSKSEKAVELRVENARILNKHQIVEDLHGEHKMQHPKGIASNCSHVESNLASDINAATLAVLNQMLWLPYFGKLSQEFLKSLKDPVSSIQNKYNRLLPFYNPQFGLQQIDDLYKNCINHMSHVKQMETDPSKYQTPTVNYANHTAGTLSQNPMELVFFQKIIEHQMQNFLNSNPLSVDANQRNDTSNLVRNSFSEVNSPLISAGLNHLNHHNDIDKTDKLNCLKKLENSCNKNMQKQIVDNKPRLTCKSLSNLLDPENITSAAIPLVNLTSGSNRNTHESNKQTDLSISKDNSNLSIPEASSRVTRSNKGNVALNSSMELSKQKKRNINFMETGSVDATIRNVESLNVDTNTALWHPLFGSSAKPGYSSPWQWTTVTATGE